MRALNKHLVMQGLGEMTTYRGSKMSEEDLAFLHGMHCLAEKRGVPLVTRVPTYYASSLSQDEAKRFMRHFMINYHIPKNCANCCSIMDWSVYPKEQEVLFPPWTAFKVVKVNSDAKPGDVAVEMEVLDNSFQPGTVTTATELETAINAPAAKRRKIEEEWYESEKQKRRQSIAMNKISQCAMTPADGMAQLAQEAASGQKDKFG